MALHYHVFKNDIENGVTKPASFALDFELVVIGKTRNLSKCQITDTKTVLVRKLELGAFNSNSFIWMHRGLVARVLRVGNKEICSKSQLVCSNDSNGLISKRLHLEQQNDAFCLHKRQHISDLFWTAKSAEAIHKDHRRDHARKGATGQPTCLNPVEFA